MNNFLDYDPYDEKQKNKHSSNMSSSEKSLRKMIQVENRSVIDNKSKLII